MEIFTVQFSAADLKVIAPELVLTIFALAILILSVFARGQKKGSFGSIALGGVVMAFLSLFLVIGKEMRAFSDMVTVDPFSIFFKVMFLIIAFLTVLASLEYTNREGIDFGEYYVLILFATMGMMLMVSGVNLLIIFLGLEVAVALPSRPVGFNSRRCAITGEDT